jgi:hypothetical protein
VVPAKISAQFQAVVDALTKTPLRDGSGYAPRQVTPEEGEKLAGQILSMFVDLQGGLRRAIMAKPPAPESSAAAGAPSENAHQKRPRNCQRQ